MLFNSIEFLLAFLPLSLLGYFLLGRAGDAVGARLWLVFASLFFYAWWDPRYLPLLLGSIAINFAIGRMFVTGVVSPAWRTPLLVTGIAANLALLGWFKYAGFFLENVAAATGYALTVPQIVLPLAISFFTFQQIAYLVDAWSGRLKSSALVDYALFVTFFPQLIAGPIVHHREMMPQFADRHVYRFDLGNFQIGLTIFLVGLFKKAVLADSMAFYSEPVFVRAHHGGEVELLAAWLGACGYALQLYFDFSGYSDMAIGLGRMFNIRLPTNFLAPYRATSIVDLWRQWHMTLTRFFRDYVYIPLGGNGRSIRRRLACMFVVMLLAGLWHGAGWTFVVWGALNGALLVGNYAWRLFVRRAGLMRLAPPRAIRLPLCWMLTMLAWIVGTTIFRADDLATAGRMFEGMLGLNGIALPQQALAALPALSGLDIGESFLTSFAFGFGWLWVGALTAVSLLLPTTLQWLERWQPSLDFGRQPPPSPAIAIAWQPALANAVLLGMALFLSLQAIVGARSAQFIYFQF